MINWFIAFWQNLKSSKRPIMNRIKEREASTKDVLSDVKLISDALQQIAQDSPQSMQELIGDYYKRLQDAKKRAKQVLIGFADLKQELNERRITRTQKKKLVTLDGCLDRLEQFIEQELAALENFCQEADELA